MSFLFLGIDYNPDIKLFIEMNDIGELSAYYCTQNQYDTAQCFNQIELLVTNILMTPIVCSRLNMQQTPKSAQLGYLLVEML